MAIYYLESDAWRNDQFMFDRGLQEMYLRTPIVVRLCVAALLVLRFSIAMAATEETVEGFRVDFQRVNDDQKAAILPSLQRQLQIVESVNLPQSIVDFFRQISIVVDPNLRIMPGQYVNLDGNWVVRVQASPMAGNKPIVLHELLHAYHRQVLTTQNPDIMEAYRHAKEPGAYPENFQSAHFLENANEYFAVIGSIYLFGEIQQPPFNCSIPSKLDPAFLTFLSKQFGPHPCRWLSEPRRS